MLMIDVNCGCKGFHDRGYSPTNSDYLTRHVVVKKKAESQTVLPFYFRSDKYLMQALIVMSHRKSMNPPRLLRKEFDMAKWLQRLSLLFEGPAKNQRDFTSDLTINCVQQGVILSLPVCSRHGGIEPVQIGMLSDFSFLPANRLTGQRAKP